MKTIHIFCVIFCLLLAIPAFAQDSDGNPASGMEAQPLSAEITPATTVLLSNSDPVPLTCTITGGKGPFTVNWTFDNAPSITANPSDRTDSENVTFNSGALGTTSNITVVVTDSSNPPISSPPAMAQLIIPQIYFFPVVRHPSSPFEGAYPPSVTPRGNTTNCGTCQYLVSPNIPTGHQLTLVVDNGLDDETNGSAHIISPPNGQLTASSGQITIVGDSEQTDPSGVGCLLAVQLDNGTLANGPYNKVV
jgi:hypothetical protein